MKKALWGKGKCFLLDIVMFGCSKIASDLSGVM